jgi:hypothetical protein
LENSEKKQSKRWLKKPALKRELKRFLTFVNTRKGFQEELSSLEKNYQ